MTIFTFTGTGPLQKERVYTTCFWVDLLGLIFDN